MKSFFPLFFFFFLLACSDTETSGEIEKNYISTGDFEATEVSKVENHLYGKWIEAITLCDSNERNCHDVFQGDQYLFERDLVKWNGYSHPFSVRNDTVYLGALVYTITSGYSDTLILKSVTTNKTIKLQRQLN